jgi:hypothetical protein
MSPQSKVLGHSFNNDEIRNKASSPKSVNMHGSLSLHNGDNNSRRSNFARAGYSISSVVSAKNES